MINTPTTPPTLSSAPLYKQIAYQQHQIGYLKMGSGSKALVALHGYGDKAQLFETLLPSLGSTYTLLALDLPYHGNTQWDVQQLYTRTDLNHIIQLILQTEGYTRCSLMAYSMGGKITLGLLPLLAPHIDELWIIAGSGIGRSNWFYSLPLPLVRRMGHFVQHPARYQWLLQQLYRFKLVAKPIYTMYKAILSTELRRLKLYHTWLSLYDFEVRLKNVQKIINQHHIKTRLIYGTRDQAISHTEAALLANGLKNAQVLLLDADHWIITPPLNAHLQQLL